MAALLSLKAFPKRKTVCVKLSALLVSLGAFHFLSQYLLTPLLTDFIDLAETDSRTPHFRFIALSKRNGHDVNMTSHYRRFPSNDSSFPEVNAPTSPISLEKPGGGRPGYLPDLPNKDSFPPPSRANLPPRPFRSPMTSDERGALLRTLQAFVGVCVQHGIPFFLYGGSLLGAFRHHDVIPWDDDVDVMLNSSDKDNLRKAMSSLNGNFSLHFDKNAKFYWREGKPLQRKAFRWPYVDVFFFDENHTHIFDQHPSYTDDFAFLKSRVFPLAYRPFAASLLPVPLCVRSVLDQNYSPSICKAPTYSHKTETGFPAHSHTSIPCTHLHSFYPFVSRTRLGLNKRRAISGVHSLDFTTTEEQRIGNVVLQTFTFQSSKLCA